MADTAHRFEITPKVIDFGNRVVALGHVTSAGFGNGHPFRLLGIVLVLAALGLVGNEVMSGKALTAIRSGGSRMLWIACIAAGFGIFAIVLPRRQLVIALSDGAKIRFSGGRSEFLGDVVRHLRAAIEADQTKHPRIVVDLAAGTIEMADAPAAAPPTDRHSTVPAAHAPGHATHVAPGHMVAATPGRMVALPHERTAPAERTQPPYRNGHANANGSGPAHAAAEALIARPFGATPGAPLPQHYGYAPQQTYGMPGPGSSSGPAAVGAGYGPAAYPGSASQHPAHDLDAVMQIIHRSDLQHKAALLELLRVAEDHLRGGATRRDDAVAHWRSFADYVHQYLTGIDGLVTATDRAGRAF